LKIIYCILFPGSSVLSLVNKKMTEKKKF